ncbi:hypothetical protein Fmac_017450 [Flemingia macrophylla]|uniref:Uncharacterized protein n=1 Tax=Flemingia macrophylla TaxID=520843 RepID=A0ABD1M250_9FABA
MDNIIVVKVIMPAESLPQGMEGQVISVYTLCEDRTAEGGSGADINPRNLRTTRISSEQMR